MILQALCEYYQRKAADPESGIAPEGFEWKEIPFLVVIDRDGRFVTLEDTREGEGKKRRGKRFLVPQGVKRTSGIKANLLWDDVEYALGANPRSRSDVKERHAAFAKRLNSELPSRAKEPRIDALLKFIEAGAHSQVDGSHQEDIWREVLADKSNVTFKIDGDPGPLCQLLQSSLQGSTPDETTPSTAGTCLVSGQSGPIVRTHPAIKGVRDAKPTGANLVSFNLHPFCSHGKTQNHNAPLSESSTFAYTTALNALLAQDSANRMHIGDASTVFWSAKRTELEAAFSDFFAMPPKDDPDRDVRAVRGLYESVAKGLPPAESSTEFYVLGLAAQNEARLSVRFWHRDTTENLAVKILLHFRDLEIARPERRHLSLFWILLEISAEGKLRNVPPNVAGDLMRAVLEGGPYPQTLLSQALRRIRAERKVTPTRAAILKASLNRARRIYSHPQQEITVALDPSNNSPGYRLGRLFAVLEKIQEDAQKGINATIRDRYYGAASASPVTVFPQLLKLKNHHLAKLENPGLRITHEKRLAEIFAGLPADMPAHLAIDEQARFAIGYYHQRHALFAKSTTNTEETAP